jgi:kynurenine formamidase
MTALPSYDELPDAPEGGKSGWHLFGEDDNLGLINLLTPEKVVEASQLVRSGKVFPLNAPIDGFAPTIAQSRGNPRHKLIHANGTINFDDVYDNVFPQASSQWDALGHMGYAPGSFYNGATEEDVVEGRRNTIEHWARRGIVGRGILLDVARAALRADPDYSPAEGRAFTVGDLEAAREIAGIEFRAGDILILHTGFVAWYLGLSMSDRMNVVRNGQTVGIAHGEDMCRYLWDSHIAAIGTDTFAVEQLPTDLTKATSFLHRILIGQFGMALGELWWTADLAADCIEDGIYEFFFSSTPTNAPGAVGSAANACAIK